MKNNNLIEYFLSKFWYYRCRFTAWRLGVIHFRVTPADDATLWEVWREFHKFLLTPKTNSVPWNEKEQWGDEEKVRQDYKRKYELSDTDAADLHMSFSPNKIKKGLSYYETKFYIEKYRYKKSLDKSGLFY